MCKLAHLYHPIIWYKCASLQIFSGQIFGGVWRVCIHYLTPMHLVKCFLITYIDFCVVFSTSFIQHSWCSYFVSCASTSFPSFLEQHMSCGDCLEHQREDYQNSLSLLCYIVYRITVLPSHKQTPVGSSYKWYVLFFTGVIFCVNISYCCRAGLVVTACVIAWKDSSLELPAICQVAC